jgi:hypothetical protein
MPHVGHPSIETYNVAEDFKKANPDLSKPLLGDQEHESNLLFRFGVRNHLWWNVSLFFIEEYILLCQEFFGWL